MNKRDRIDKLIAKWTKQFELLAPINAQKANLIGKFIRDLKKLEK
jgi:hypothetical protein